MGLRGSDGDGEKWAVDELSKVNAVDNRAN